MLSVCMIKLSICVLHICDMCSMMREKERSKKKHMVQINQYCTKQNTKERRDKLVVARTIVFFSLYCAVFHTISLPPKLFSSHYIFHICSTIIVSNCISFYKRPSPPSMITTRITESSLLLETHYHKKHY